MDKTIGNPLSWAARQVMRGSSHVAASTREIAGDAGKVPREAIATLTLEDLTASLRAGWDDLLAFRADALFLCLLYPVLGLVLLAFAMQQDLQPLLFPLVTGFVLIGPLAALGLYEMSRQRDEGGEANWSSAFAVLDSPSFAAVVVLGGFLVGLMLLWLLSASLIYALTLGPEPPQSIAALAVEVATTPAGWTLAVVGVAVGFAFALLVLVTSVISFPLLLDRHVGVANAVVTSVRVCRKNPGVMLAWGGIVAAGLFLGALPALIGLAVTLPVLGHATWHLYRRAVRMP